jgi:dihydrofolate synthase/folylpolyglutamate synthase
MTIVTWLNNLEKFGMKLGLERISRLLEALGNPQCSFNSVHIAGTNGKGTVSHLIGNMLLEEGYKTGVYTSPHLQEFSERITINNDPILAEDIEKYGAKVKSAMEKNDISATFFEVVTALALLYFHHQKVRFAVIETGLGGRLDATNMVNPSLSIITNVTREHSDVLGETIEEIAGEKAGIIKQAPVITAAVEPALSVIKKIAQEKNTSICVIGEDVTWRAVELYHFSVAGQDNYDVRTILIGDHQGENIALAIAASEYLNLSKKSILTGILRTSVPGRTEIIAHDPIILLDGAHNPAAMKQLKDTLLSHFCFHRLILVLGILKDKDISAMLLPLARIGDCFILTESSNPRACPVNHLIDIAQKILPENKVVISNKEISKALEIAQNLAKKNDLICITGSLFTVGEGRSYFANIFK